MLGEIEESDGTSRLNRFVEAKLPLISPGISFFSTLGSLPRSRSLSRHATAAHIRTTFLSHCFCGLMKGPIMYQQIENDVSVRAKKDNGTSGRSFNLATDFLSLFFYGGQNRNTEKSSGRKLKVFRGFFALRY